MPSAAIVAIIVLSSSVLTALVTNFIAPLFRERFIEAWRARRERRLRSLEMVYEPLCTLIMATPMTPGETVEDLDFDILAAGLKAAQKIVSANVLDAQQVLRKRASGWDELYFYKDTSALAPEMRWLFEHVDERFEKLRSDLGYE